MNNKTKSWLWLAASLVLVGGLIFVGLMMTLRWDFTKLSTVKYETNTYAVDESFTDILVDTDTFDIKFVPSEDSKCRVVCLEPENEKNSVTVKDGKLIVRTTSHKKWYDFIGISFQKPQIIIHLPENEYTKLTVKSSTGKIAIPEDFIFDIIEVTGSTGNVTCYASATELLSIKLSTGSICVKNISASAVNLTVSTGKVTASDISCSGEVFVGVSTGDTLLTDISCGSMISKGDTGDIRMNHVIAEKSLCVERSTGDVNFEYCDGAEISIQTDTGDVSGSLLSDKVFFVTSSTGDIRVPETKTGGKCEIRTSTGDIIITLS